MIEIQSLTMPYGIHLIHELKFQVGSRVGIIGPNGSGKSTLLRAMTGYLKPNRGSIKVNGQDINRTAPSERRRMIGYMPTHELIIDGMTVLQSLELGLENSSAPWIQRSQKNELILSNTLDKIGLAHKSHTEINELSSGEFQRVRLGRLLIQNPKVLLLDEPFNFLDPTQARSIAKIMETTIHRNQTILMAIHDINIASYCCDHLLLLKSGRIINHGKVDELMTSEVFNQVFGDTLIDFKHPKTNKNLLCWK